MKFTAERSAAIKALSFAAKYAASESGIPVLASIRLIAESGSVMATATDLDRAAQCSFPAEVGEGGACCVPAVLFLKFIEQISRTEFCVDADGKSANVSSGRQKLSLPVLAGSDFPALPMLDETTGNAFALDAGLLRKVSTQVSFAVETGNKTRFYLAGTSWRASNGKIEFCATDGKRLSLLAAPCPSDLDIIVPAFDMPKWTGDVAIVATDRFIRFHSGGHILASKLIDGSFPDIHRVIPKGGRKLSFDRQELLNSVKQASIISESREHSILLVGRDGVASVSGAVADKSSSSDIQYEGGDFEWAATSLVLTSVLSSFESEIINLAWIDHTTGMVATADTDADRLAIMQPYQDKRLAAYLQRDAA